MLGLSIVDFVGVYGWFAGVSLRLVVCCSNCLIVELLCALHGLLLIVLV